jgi:hypothetical protein
MFCWFVLLIYVLLKCLSVVAAFLSSSVALVALALRLSCLVLPLPRKK